MWELGDYGEVARRLEPMAAELMAVAEAASGGLASCHLVDVATGTGNVALQAARRGALVTGVDAAPSLLAAAAARAEGEGLGVRWVMGDLADPAVADRAAREAADVVTSCLGHVFVPDIEACVAAVAAMLRPGGVFAYTSWEPWPADPSAAPLAGHVGVCDPDRTPTAWGLPEVARARLAPFFDDVRVGRRALTWEFASSVEAADWFTTVSPLHCAVMASMAPHRQQRLREAFVDAFGAHETSDGLVRWRSPYVLVSATRR